MFFSLCCFIFKLLIKIFYTLEVKGLEFVPKGITIIASNHVSYMDSPLIAITYPRSLYFFGRKSLFKNRFFSYVLKKINTHPIASGADGAKALDVAVSLLENDHSIVLFPEGTRSANGKLLPLRRGVAMLSIKSRVPITPVYVHGPFEIWSRHRKFPRLSGKITVTYGMPLDPKNYSHLTQEEAVDFMIKDLQKVLISMEEKN